MTAPQAPKIRCRAIAASDVEAVADLLTAGFPGRGRAYWRAGLARQAERPVPEGFPRFGYLLEAEGRAVGAILLLFTARPGPDGPEIRCNISSWYVEPAYRSHGAMLAMMPLRHKQATFINVSPAMPTWPIIEAQGFKRYCSGLLFALPLFARSEPGLRVETVGPGQGPVAGLPPEESELLVNHAGYGCLSLVGRGPDGEAQPFVLTPYRIRAGRLPLPAMQLIYCRSVEDFRRYGRAIGGRILRRGAPVVVVDANGPVEGLPGHYTEKRGRKYFRGPVEPRLADLAETELVLYGP